MLNQIRSETRPVLIMSSVLAGAGVFVSGTAFIDSVPRWVAGLAALVVSAVAVGWGRYTEGQVVPYEAVAARELPSGTVVAGPAAEQKTGAQVAVISSRAAAGEDLAPHPDL
jgi:hypothetical protein